MKRRSRREPKASRGCAGCGDIIALEAAPALAALARVIARSGDGQEDPAADCLEARLLRARANYADVDAILSSCSRITELMVAGNGMPDPREWLAESNRKPVDLEALLGQAMDNAELKEMLRAHGPRPESFDVLGSFLSREKPVVRVAGNKVELRGRTMGSLKGRWAPATSASPLVALLGTGSTRFAGVWQDMRDTFAGEVRRLEDAGPAALAGQLTGLEVLFLIAVIAFLVGSVLYGVCEATKSEAVCFLVKMLWTLALILLGVWPILLLGNSRRPDPDGEQTLADQQPLVLHLQRSPAAEPRLPPNPATS